MCGRPDILRQDPLVYQTHQLCDTPEGEGKEQKGGGDQAGPSAMDKPGKQSAGTETRLPKMSVPE